MNWDIFYPWIKVKEEYSGKVAKSITINCYVFNCEFTNNKGQPLITCTNSGNIFVLIDRTVFSKCDISDSDKGIVYFNTAGSICCSIIYSLFANCQSTAASTRIVRILTPDSQLSTIKMMRNTFRECGYDSSKILHSVLNVNNGHQSYQELNSSKCNSYTYNFLFDHTSNGIASWLNVERNQVSDVLFYINYRGIVRKSNFINNTQTSSSRSDYYGIIATYDPGSTIVVEECVFLDNNCKSLSWITNGVIYFLQCNIDNPVNTKSVVVRNNVAISVHTFPEFGMRNVITNNKRLCYLSIILSNLFV